VDGMPPVRTERQLIGQREKGVINRIPAAYSERTR
jgi:hypothetical protein